MKLRSVIILTREGINVVALIRRRLAFKSRHFEPNTNANWTIAIEMTRKLQVR